MRYVALCLTYTLDMDLKKCHIKFHTSTSYVTILYRYLIEGVTEFEYVNF